MHSTIHLAKCQLPTLPVTNFVNFIAPAPTVLIDWVTITWYVNFHHGCPNYPATLIHY